MSGSGGLCGEWSPPLSYIKFQLKGSFFKGPAVATAVAGIWLCSFLASAFPPWMRVCLGSRVDFKGWRALHREPWLRSLTPHGCVHPSLSHLCKQPLSISWTLSSKPRAQNPSTKPKPNQQEFMVIMDLAQG